jgi:hypothetical protein
MTQDNRGRVVGALLLILGGLYLFAIQFVPALRVLAINESNWPLIIVGIGVALLLAALLTWTPPLMVPAAILGGLGALLFWQNATDNWARWASWAYAWTLLPVFAGIGVLLMHLMYGNPRQGIVAGGGPILGGLIGFLLFGSFFGALGTLGHYWPLLLILLGVLVLAQGFWRRA